MPYIVIFLFLYHYAWVVNILFLDLQQSVILLGLQMHLDGALAELLEDGSLYLGYRSLIDWLLS